MLENPEHRPIVGHHLGDEALDPDAGGPRGQLLEQARADAAALPRVGDGEGRLGEGRVAQPDVVRERDDVLLVVGGDGARSAPRSSPVGLEHGLDELGDRRGEAVEPEVEAAFEAGEEGQQRVGVLLAAAGGVAGVPVAEDDVDDVRGRGHARQCRRHAGRMRVQWLIVPSDWPTFSSPTIPRSTEAKEWLTNG